MQKCWLIHGSHASRVVQRKPKPARSRCSRPLRGPPSSPFTHCTLLSHSLHHFAITGLAPTILPLPDAHMWRTHWHSCQWLTAKARLENIQYILFDNCGDAKQLKHFFLLFLFFIEWKRKRTLYYTIITKIIYSSLTVGHCIMVLLMLNSATSLKTDTKWKIVHLYACLLNYYLCPIYSLAPAFNRKKYL